MLAGSWYLPWQYNGQFRLVLGLLAILSHQAERPTQDQPTLQISEPEGGNVGMCNMHSP